MSGLYPIAEPGGEGWGRLESLQGKKSWYNTLPIEFENINFLSHKVMITRNTYKLYRSYILFPWYHKREACGSQPFLYGVATWGQCYYCFHRKPTCTLCIHVLWAKPLGLFTMLSFPHHRHVCKRYTQHPSKSEIFSEHKTKTLRYTLPRACLTCFKDS